MKTLLWILVVLAAAAGGFFGGKYYEANRPLEIEDVKRFRQRLANQAGDWADGMTEKFKGAIGAD